MTPQLHKQVCKLLTKHVGPDNICYTLFLQETLEKMARTTAVKFDMSYKVEFTAPIRGHHIYKETWCPKIGELLYCHKDDREEAMQYDRNAIGVFQPAGKEGKENLVGHVPIEISQLTSNFILAGDTNSLVSVVIGKRKREI